LVALTSHLTLFFSDRILARLNHKSNGAAEIRRIIEAVVRQIAMPPENLEAVILLAPQQSQFIPSAWA
jgi:hypothetical protein